ncbi:MAG: LLM class flavin-dependent oxidoreductase [Pyrinomonadaceae bacterium]|nr:LLM class flavin-dependent oxidoreductase [Pyrinomonadaceae bacterium]
MSLKFHWRLPHGGETLGDTRAGFNRASLGLPDLQAQIAFCRQAEQCGIDSLLTDFGYAKPDPILLATALGLATEKIKFIIAYRSGLLSPATFVQQLNTLSALINGRFSLNIVAGYSPPEQRSYGDFLAHDERYDRTDEYLSICHAFWKSKGEVNFAGKHYKIENGSLHTPFVSGDRAAPEIFIAGSSLPAQRLALRQGTCWLRFADTPESVAADTLAISRQGIAVGLRLSVITRETRQEALSAAYSLIANMEVKGSEKEFIQRSDSFSMKATYELAEDEWLKPYLWTGAIRYVGATAIALVGTPEEIASAIMEYKAAGVSQFILSGWPKLDEMIRFGRDVLPLVRMQERALPSSDKTKSSHAS